MGLWQKRCHFCSSLLIFNKAYATSLSVEALEQKILSEKSIGIRAIQGVWPLYIPVTGIGTVSIVLRAKDFAKEIRLYQNEIGSHDILLYGLQTVVSCVISGTSICF